MMQFGFQISQSKDCFCFTHICHNCKVNQDAELYYFKVPITYTCSNEKQWFILLLQHSCDEMLYFVILLFCLCESHDVYFLYAFSTLYVFNILSIKLAVVLYIDEMKCLESMEMFFAFVLVSVIKILLII